LNHSEKNYSESRWQGTPDRDYFEKYPRGWLPRATHAIKSTIKFDSRLRAMRPISRIDMRRDLSWRNYTTPDLPQIFCKGFEKSTELSE
jgi:hypothetical protein